MQEGKVVAYTSCQLKDYEKNYLTHDLKMTVVVFALNILRNYLYGIKSVRSTSTSRVSKYLFTQKELNMRQRKWVELVKDYDCTI
jgi:hypothetical protein